MANRIGVTRRAVYEWETDVRLPRHHLPQLADLYGQPVTMLLYGMEPASEELAQLRADVVLLNESFGLFVLEMKSQVTALAQVTEAALREVRAIAEERLAQRPDGEP